MEHMVIHHEAVRYSIFRQKHTVCWNKIKTRKEEKMILSKVGFFYQQTYAKTSLNQQQVRGLTTHEIVIA